MMLKHVITGPRGHTFSFSKIWSILISHTQDSLIIIIELCLMYMGTEQVLNVLFNSLFMSYSNQKKILSMADFLAKLLTIFTLTRCPRLTMVQLIETTHLQQL